MALSSNSYNLETDSSANMCTRYTVLPVNDLTFKRSSPSFPVASLIWCNNGGCNERFTFFKFNHAANGDRVRRAYPRDLRIRSLWIRKRVSLTELLPAHVADFEPRGCFVAGIPAMGLVIFCSLILLISAVLDAFGRNTGCMPSRLPDKLADLERGRRRLPMASGWLKNFDLDEWSAATKRKRMSSVSFSTWEGISMMTFRSR